MNISIKKFAKPLKIPIPRENDQEISIERLTEGKPKKESKENKKDKDIGTNVCYEAERLG